MNSINGSIQSVSSKRVEAGELCQKDINFKDGINTPLEISLVVPVDLLTLTTAGNVGGKKGAVVEGEITDCTGKKEKYELTIKNDLNEYIKGKYGDNSINVRVDPNPVDGKMKLSGYVGPEKENAVDNQELYLTAKLGGFNIAGSVNGIPVEQTLMLDPLTMGANLEGKIGDSQMKTKVWTAEDMKSQPLEGTFGKYQETGKAYMDENKQVTVERIFLEASEDGTMHPKYTVVEKFRPL